MPGAKPFPMPTTAEAAHQAAVDGDPTHVAIVSPEAVVLYGLTLLADDIGDHTAFTRFVSIGRFTSLDVPHETARTAFSFVTRHQPGALHAAIEPFARAGLDLQRLDSRPLPATPWQYRFDAVVAGHPLDPTVRLALRELRAAARELRVVGVYDAHEEEA
jgi:chorismate mutase/prephenate dehydratase